MACSGRSETELRISVGPLSSSAKQSVGAELEALHAVENPVCGQVVDVAGRPLPRALVTLFRRTREWPRGDRVQLHSPVWTGADGRFEFGITRDPHLELSVVAAGFASRTMLPPPRVAQCVVSLQPGYRVIGSVLDPEDSPCVGCEVFLEEARIGSRMRARRTTTDSRGRFEFGGVPAETLRLVARHPDYQPAVLSRATVGAHRFHTLEFHDRSGLQVSGTVSDGNSKGLVDGLVRVYPNSSTGLLTVPYESSTDAEGRFHIAGLAPGAYMMEIRHPDYSSMQRRLSLKRSSVSGLQMVLPHRARLRGRLTGSAGLAGKQLSVVSFLGEVATTTVAEDGSFAFPGSGFSLGMATLELAEGDLCFAASKSRWHWVLLRDDDQEHTLATKPASLMLGRVLDVGGRPLADVQVVALLKRFGDLGLLSSRRHVVAVTDEAGCYTIRGLGPGEVSLGFLKGSFAYRQESAVALPQLAADPRRVTRLHRPGVIQGRVIRGGQPVPGALVMVNRGLHRIRKARTDLDGHYRLVGLAPGEHQVRVKFGILPMEHLTELVLLQPGKTVKGVDIELPSRHLRGRLVDSQDTPMPNVLVETPSGMVATTGDDGGFELNIPPGETWLSIRLRRGDPVTQRFVAGARRTSLTVEVHIAPRARLRARILCMPSEVPATGVVLHLDRPPSQVLKGQPGFRERFVPDLLKGAWEVIERGYSRLDRYERRTVERWVELDDGLLELSNLPNRTMRLTIRAKGYVPYVQIVKLQNGKPIDLGVIRLRRGSRIHGQVVDSWGKPLNGARVVLGRESELAKTGSHTVYLTDGDGRFMARGVALSNRRLYVAADGFATTVHDLDLPGDSLRRRSQPVRIQMRTGATIQVRIEDGASQPLGYVMVRLYRGGELIARQRTDEDGRVAFTHLARDDYRVSVWGRRQASLGLSVSNTSGNRIYRRTIVVRD